MSTQDFHRESALASIVHINHMGITSSLSPEVRNSSAFWAAILTCFPSSPSSPDYSSTRTVHLWPSSMAVTQHSVLSGERCYRRSWKIRWQLSRYQTLSTMSMPRILRNSTLQWWEFLAKWTTTKLSPRHHHTSNELCCCISLSFHRAPFTDTKVNNTNMSSVCW